MSEETLQRLRSAAWSELGLALSVEQVQRFAALVAEGCAKVCDTASDSYAVGWDADGDKLAQASSKAADSCAESIRAKFKVPK